MAEAEGWIKLYRKLMINDLWIKEPFTRGQAWVDLLLLANHKDGFIRVRGIKIPVLRGQVGWSERKLGDRWKWSRGKVKRFISELQNERQIEPQKNNETSIVTIVNYDLYQENRPQNEPQNERQTGHKRATNGPQTDTNKNVKNEKNESNTVSNRAFAPPSLQQVTEYCLERNNGIDPQRFINHYTANGWVRGKAKIKDWKACVRTWESNQKPKQSGLDYLERMAKGDD